VLEQPDLRQLRAGVRARPVAGWVVGRKVDDTGRDTKDASVGATRGEEGIDSGEETAHVCLNKRAPSDQR